MDTNSAIQAGGLQAFTSERAVGYKSASISAPMARASEITCIEHALLTAGIDNANNVVEVGAGQGFATSVLLKLLPSDATLISIEPSAHMAAHLPNDHRLTKKICALTSAQLAKDSVDLIVSVAAFHHITNKYQTFLECHSILREGGTLIIIDVNHGTEAQRWFDFVVNHHCPSRHEADFLDEDFSRILSKRSGLRHVRSYIEQTPWRFDSREEMDLYAQGIFCLTTNQPDIRQLINQNLKPAKHNGMYEMSWSLGVHIFIKSDF